jgi:P27 family predicted phage terminase small subunit
MTPEELHVRGSHRAKGRQSGLALPLKAPACPRDLHPYARETWRKVVPVLLDAGVLSVADAPLLRSYCEACAEARVAAELLEKEGRTFKTDKGYIGPHPAISMQRSAWRAVAMLAKALGIEPAGRAPAPKPEPYDPMEEFLDATAVTN